MSRNLDSTLASALSDNLISPVILAALEFQSGTIYVWSGVGTIEFNGNTFIGVGSLGSISPVNEGSDIKADGMTIKLSGIGLSPLDVNNPQPTGVTPPIAIPSGQFLAWSYPQGIGTAVVSGTGQGFKNGTVGAIGTSGLQPGVTVFDRGTAQLTFGNFTVPNLPSGAVIQSIIPVFVGQSTITESDFTGGFGFPFPGPNFSGQYSAPNLIPSIGMTPEQVIENYSSTWWIAYSGDGALYEDTVNINFLGLAVYYTAPSNASTLINEAMADMQIGGDAKIWFGLLSGGEFVGNPYLIFSGLIDQPTVDISTQTASIEIALESRLTNLQRPTARRYTSADQHLKYPDDIGFAWVEFLNDIALVWG